MKFKGIIFDFDGTLANLTIDFQKIKRKILLLADIFFEHKKIDVDSLPLLECIDVLTGELKKVNNDLAKEFNTRCRLILVDMEMRAARRGRLFPYTLDILNQLKKNGINIGVITRNCTPAVKMVFPDIEQEVDVFLPREDVPRVKPDPIHVQLAMERLSLNRDEVLVVGDHPIDILCAKKIGVKSAAVSSGRISFEELKTSDPDFLEKDLKELYERLKLLNLI
jgi:phosphoglycolate phosphatase